jgi:hypothetical protein
MNETQPLDEINSAPTERVETPEIVRRPPTVAGLLAQQLDWLQVDIENINQNVVSAHSRQSVALSEIKADIRYTWIALLAVAAFLLMNAVMLGAIIYQLGLLIGHMR